MFGEFQSLHFFLQAEGICNSFSSIIIFLDNFRNILSHWAQGSLFLKHLVGFNQQQLHRISRGCYSCQIIVQEQILVFTKSQDAKDDK